VPSEITALSITEVFDRKCPLKFLTSFDDSNDTLVPGMITGWPSSQLRKL